VKLPVPFSGQIDLSKRRGTGQRSDQKQGCPDPMKLVHNAYMILLDIHDYDLGLQVFYTIGSTLPMEKSEKSSSDHWGAFCVLNC
jgi:hypothetical protein